MKPKPTYKELEKEIEKLLKEKEEVEYFKTVFNNSSDGLIIHDNKKIINVNDKFLQMRKVKRENIRNKPLNELLSNFNYSKEIKENILNDEIAYEFELPGKVEEHKIHIEVKSKKFTNNNNICKLVSIRDIPDRKKAEQALLQSEEKYRLIAENVSDVIWIFNISKDKFTYISPAEYKLTGYTAAEAMQLDLREQLSDESAKRAEETIQIETEKFIKNPGYDVIQVNDYQQKCKDGSFVWIETSTTFRYNSANEIEIVGITRNIEDRKKAEEALKESEVKYRGIVDNMIDGFYKSDAAGKATFISPSVTKITGFHEDEIIGKDISSFYAYPGKLKIFLNELMKTGKVENYSEEFINKDKPNIFIETNAQAIYKNGKYNGVEGVFRDVTDRKKTEQNLIETKNELIHANKNLIEQQKVFMVGNVVVFKWQNKEGWPVEFVSENVENVFGYNQEEFITGKVNFSELINKDDIEIVAKEVNHAINNNLNYFEHKEYRITNKHGEEVWLYDFTTILRNDKNEITHFFGYVMNVSDRKKAENELKESEAKLQKSNLTKDKFFSIIAHDLKSPFNAILGFSNMLLENHKEYDDERRERLIKSGNSSAKNAFKLLENLLTWSHSQSGAIEYSPEKLHLKILLFETMFDLQGQADTKNIHVLDNVSENALIFADKNMIATVLRNLISNAIKFTNKGGSIIISSERQTESNFIKILVEDTGIGIPKDTIDGLFRIDENISTKGTENETGTGLGLILCKEFVEKHDGEIWVKSETGKGSSFYFTIPGSD